MDTATAAAVDGAPDAADGGRTRSLSDTVYENTLIYGKGVLRTQFPNAIDGFKRIHTRIMWVGRRTEFFREVGALRLIAGVKEIHNHGDESIYDTIVRMSQPYAYRPPLIDFDGDNGTYDAPKAAHQRYTSLAISRVARALLYDGIDTNSLPKQPTDSRDDFEPKHFIPALPLALVYDNLTVGYGFQSITAPLNFANVCDLTTAFCKHMVEQPTKPFPLAAHADKLLPDFPVPNRLTNADELLAAYKRGEYAHRIALEGDVQLTADTIFLRAMPYGTKFLTAKESLEKAIEERDPPWADQIIAQIDNLSALQEIGNVSIRLKRGVNVFEAWERISRFIVFATGITPNVNYVTTDGYIVKMTPDGILRAWYQARYNLVMSSKRRQLAELQHELHIQEAIRVVIDHMDAVIAIIRANDRDPAVLQLCETFKLTRFQAEKLVQVPLITLSRTSRAAVEAVIATLAEKLTALKASFTRIAQEIGAEAQRLKKEYAPPRLTKIPRYIGYVAVGGGCIQIESVAEIPAILEDFPRGPLDVHIYDGPHLLRVAPNGKPSTAIPRITSGDIYGLRFNGDAGYTVNIQDGAACCVKGIVPGLRSDGYFYTTRKAVAITRRGEVRHIDVTTELSMRKTICRGANTDIIYVYPDTGKRHYVAMVNDKEPNVITLQAVDAEAGRIIMSPVGTVHLVHSYSATDWFFSIPEAFLNRVSARVFHILDAEALLDCKRSVRLDVGTAAVKRSKWLKLLS